MINKLIAAAAVSGLALTTALAQAPSPTTPATPSTPSATAPGMSGKADSAKFVSKQTQDQWLASKFKGTDVVGTDDQKIGDVSDILMDKNGKVLAFIVGVGGFLGIGAKDVAIDPASFQMVPGRDASDMKLRLSMTKDELKAAPAFERYAPPRPVTSETRPMGAPSPTGPGGSPPAPKQ
jgi:sporulation protein YlmC with PRC-barrel domain